MEDETVVVAKKVRVQKLKNKICADDNSLILN